MSIASSMRRLGPGLLAVLLISALAFALARVYAVAELAISALTIAILIGALLGNRGHRVLSNQLTQQGPRYGHSVMAPLPLVRRERQVAGQRQARDGNSQVGDQGETREARLRHLALLKTAHEISKRQGREERQRR